MRSPRRLGRDYPPKGSSLCDRCVVPALADFILQKVTVDISAEQDVNRTWGCEGRVS